MCGIVGCLNLNADPFHWNKDQDFFEKMMQTQRHRGPDDQGIRGFQFKNKINAELCFNAGFGENLDGMIGFNRLSIQDLSLRGHQPMTDEKESVILAFNGEIYNAGGLRSSLEAKGYTFRGNSDTEVILNMYLEYGIECIKKLNGMFAITMIDIRKRTAYLARDRFGIKPMYYYGNAGHFFWASEYKCFLFIPGFVPKINQYVLNEYMMFQSSPDNVLLEGINQLKPGELITIQEGRMTKELFYDLDCLKHEEDGTSLTDNMEKLDAILQDAVSRQMISDVKVGCQLSGGVDSSLVSYYAYRHEANELKDSVSITFRDFALNEEPYMDVVMQQLNLRGHKYELNREFLVRNLKKTIWHLETLPTHPNSIALLLLTREAKKHVTVLLSGEGADELFGGYPEYTTQYFVQKYLERGPMYQMMKDNDFRKKAWFGCGDEKAEVYAVHSGLILSPENAARLFGMEKNTECIQRREQQFLSYGGDFFDKMVKYQMATYLPELLLRQDKMSMANSIENRVPLLDNEVVDFSFHLPYQQLIYFHGNRNGRLFNMDKLIAQTSGKYILKKICGEKFGKEFAFRGKGGFGLPLKYYFSSDMFRKFFYQEVLEPMKKRNFVDASFVERLFLRAPVLDWREIELLWKAICIELYMQMFFERN